MGKISLKPFFCKPNFVNSSLNNVTSFGGLPLVRDVIRDLKLNSEMKCFDLKHSGYDDAVILEALLLMLVAGGQHLSDWEYLKLDPGFKKLFPADLSVDTLERYLDRLSVVNLPGVSNGQGAVGYCELLERLHQKIILRAYKNLGSPKKLTLDLDATLIETQKSDALYCYDKYKAYQPLIGYCPELGLVLSHEFRDGNIPAGLGMQRMVEKVRSLLPDVDWTLRSDAAAYQNDFLDWMNRNDIRFFVTADQTQGMQQRIAILQKSTEWQAYVNQYGIKTGEEYQRLYHGPSFTNQAELDLRIHHRHYIVIRKKIKNGDLLTANEYVYSVFVTNDFDKGMNNLIQEHRGRCGSVEYSHNQIKAQCGQGVMPSNKFHVNAAYFSMGILAHNLLRYMQRHVLPESYKNLEIQTIRFRLIRVVAKIIHQARSTIIGYLKDHPIGNLHQEAQKLFQSYSP